MRLEVAVELAPMRSVAWPVTRNAFASVQGPMLAVHVDSIQVLRMIPSRRMLVCRIPSSSLALTVTFILSFVNGLFLSGVTSIAGRSFETTLNVFVSDRTEEPLLLTATMKTLWMVPRGLVSLSV